MTSHVFITEGDLTQLACDAWLLPTDGEKKVEEPWLTKAPQNIKSLADRAGRLQIDHPAGWGGTIRAMKLEGWNPGGRAQPWLVRVGLSRGLDPESYLEGLPEFLDCVSDDLAGRREVAWRARPLVALPVIATGRGGAHDIKGIITTKLLEALHAEAARRPFDIALVTRDHRALSAAQSARKDLLAKWNLPSYGWLGWTELSKTLRDCADRLAQMARNGELVLFLGAGVSATAGLPTWEQLLAELGRRVKLPQDRGKLSNLDLADLISRRFLASGEDIGEAIVTLLQSSWYSLMHSLLASLPVREVATTNYDRLFEKASEEAGYKPAVLPWEPVAGRQRWVLKLHGCVTHPKDIVLSRENYLRYHEGRAALAGIVQALLITRHMLFVGFSLSDDNFHRIADDVRRALHREGRQDRSASSAFGTALFPLRDTLLAELWSGDVNCVGIEDGDAPAGETSDEMLRRASRHLEIFLDYLLAKATSNVSHLLDPSYEGMLGRDEREVAAALRTLKGSIPDQAHESEAWRPVLDLLRRLGDGDVRVGDEGLGRWTPV